MDKVNKMLQGKVRLSLYKKGNLMYTKKRRQYGKTFR